MSSILGELWFSAGRRALLHKQWGRANDLFEKSVDDFRRDSQLEKAAIATAFLAWTQLKQSKNDAGAQLATEALAQLKSTGQTVTEAKAVCNHVLADQPREIGKIKRADALQNALSLYRKLDRISANIKLTIDLARVAVKIGKPEVARSLIEQEIDVLLLDAANSNHQESLHQLADVYAAIANSFVDRVQYSIADTFWTRWFEIYTDSLVRGDDTSVKTVAHYLQFQTLIGRHQHVEEVLQSALVPKRECIEDVDVSIELVTEQLQHELHYGTLAAAKEFLVKIDDHLIEVGGESELATLERSRLAILKGEFEIATVLLDRVLQAPGATAHSVCQNEAYWLKSLLDVFKGNATNVIQDATSRLRQMDPQGGDILQEAFCLHAYANALLRTSATADALPVADRAMRKLEMLLGTSSRFSSAFLLTLAESHIITQQYDLAERILTQSAALCPPGPWGRWLRAHVHGQIGQLMYFRGEYSQAFDLFWKSITELQAFCACDEREHPLTGYLYLDLATHAHAQCWFTDRDRHFDQAKAIFFTISEKPTHLAYELNQRGNRFFAAKLFQEALWLYERSTNEYIDTVGPDHAFSIQAMENKLQAEQRLNEEQPSIVH